MLQSALLYTPRKNIPLHNAIYTTGYGKQQVGKRCASLGEVCDVARRTGNWENTEAVLLVMGISYVNL